MIRHNIGHPNIPSYRTGAEGVLAPLKIEGSKNRTKRKTENLHIPNKYLAPLEQNPSIIPEEAKLFLVFSE